MLVLLQFSVMIKTLLSLNESQAEQCEQNVMCSAVGGKLYQLYQMTDQALLL